MKSPGPTQHPDSSLLCDFLRSPCKTLLKDDHVFLSVSFRSSSNCLSCISSLIWWSYKYTFLDFCFSNIWELIHQIFEFRIHSRFYPYISQSFSCGPALWAKGTDKFFPEEQDEDWRHFLPCRQWCSFKPQFIYIVILLVRAVSLVQETAICCAPEFHSE